MVPCKLSAVLLHGFRRVLVLLYLAPIAAKRKQQSRHPPRWFGASTTKRPGPQKVRMIFRGPGPLGLNILFVIILVQLVVVGMHRVVG